MRKKLFSLIATLCLLMSSTISVNAATTTLPINYGNSYGYTKTGGGLSSIQCLSLVTTKYR